MGEIVSRGEWGTLGLVFPDAPKQMYADEGARIINEVKGINRVTYDITSKPPGTIEWE